MRSDLIFGAMTHVPNRFLLASALAKATRGLHRPGTRIADTTNDLLARFGRTNPIAAEKAAQDSATLPRRRGRPQPVISRKSKRHAVPLAHENSQARSEGLRALGT
jgi:hypothetical protein